MHGIIDTHLFDKVRDAMDEAILVAWDGCHKIYVALDETEAEWFRQNYENIVESSPEVMLDVLGNWWDDSCGLRFISGVRHNAEDPNKGFINLIAQFEDDEDDAWDDDDSWDDDDEDEDDD